MDLTYIPQHQIFSEYLPGARSFLVSKSIILNKTDIVLADFELWWDELKACLCPDSWWTLPSVAKRNISGMFESRIVSQRDNSILADEHDVVERPLQNDVMRLDLLVWHDLTKEARNGNDLSKGQWAKECKLASWSWQRQGTGFFLWVFRKSTTP